MENGKELAAAKERIKQLEEGVALLVSMNINLLTVLKEYGRGIAEVRDTLLGKEKAEAIVARLFKKPKDPRDFFKAEANAAGG